MYIKADIFCGFPLLEKNRTDSIMLRYTKNCRHYALLVYLIELTSLTMSATASRDVNVLLHDPCHEGTDPVYVGDGVDISVSNETGINPYADFFISFEMRIILREVKALVQDLQHMYFPSSCFSPRQTDISLEDLTDFTSDISHAMVIAEGLLYAEEDNIYKLLYHQILRKFNHVLCILSDHWDGEEKSILRDKYSLYQDIKRFLGDSYKETKSYLLLRLLELHIQKTIQSVSLFHSRQQYPEGM